MKSESQARRELELLQQDLKEWRSKYERSSGTDTTRRLILGNTIVGLEGREEALLWVLEED